ncbi:MAG: RimK family alpha-L-glutamate ligase [Clostridiales bacterium]|nr:RimK family alpha-L-glutamate ligase [Clostridiales bacterium]
MKGFILINGYPNGEKFYRQSGRIAEELQKLGIPTDILKNGEVSAWIDGEGRVQSDLAEKYDFCIYLDKDKYLGKLLEKIGLRLFNCAQAIEDCDDKMLTYIALSEQGVKTVETIAAPLCYTPKAKTDEKFLKKVADKLGFPLVVKKSYGSFGAGVQLVHGMPELIKTSQEFLYEPHVFQRYVADSCGRDVRVMLIGGKVVAAMERCAQKGEFRSNIELGGVGKRIELSPDYIEISEKAAKILRLDYCGVDLLQTKDGPIVCEVNSNAFFEGLEQTTGVNVAKAYAQHVYQMIKGQ